MKLEVEARIREIGAQGDGIAILEDGRRLYVPYTMPGDYVRVRIDGPRSGGFAGRAVAILTKGPGRSPPPCCHFGSCGGCALQHLDPQHYQAWKLELLTRALTWQKVEAGALRPLFITPAGSRRRVDFTALRRKAALILGFNARSSHQVIDLSECPILWPEIVALLGPLRELLLDILDPADVAEAIIVRTDSGHDMLLVTNAQLGRKRRERLAAFAERTDLARISRRHTKSRGTEVMIERRPVRVRFDDVYVSIPPGAFLQASTEGEATLRRAVHEALGPAQRIADLYAGCGTFALPLAAEGRQVHAVEGDRHLVEAIEGAVRASAGRLRLSTAKRDLDRRPLKPEELRRAQAVIFDPPRTGAKAQAEALALSEVERVVAVSCNPATFVRDARVLLDGGYRLDWVQPVDQFLWSPHLELVGAFSRA